MHHRIEQQIPVNGEINVLTAQDGYWGKLHPCTRCETAPGKESKCKFCEGTGEVHIVWHPMDFGCLNALTDNADEKLSTPEAITAWAFSLLFLAMSAAALYKTALWILQVNQ